MKPFVYSIIVTLLLVSVAAVADENGSSGKAEETIPKTVHGGGRTIKKGGKNIGKGFRGIGRGIKDVFTGERSKEDFKEGKKVGTGFKDLGRGTAGVGRGVGRNVKKAFTDDEESDTSP